VGAEPSGVVEFRVLGSLEAVADGRPLTLGEPRQRALLAVLLLHRGRRVSSDALVDALWGDAPPPSAVKIVQGYVSGLRRVLGDGFLVTRDHGYVLHGVSTDLDRFEALAAEGRRALADGDAAAAAGRLRAALALWRGPPLADFAYDAFAAAEIARLEEARLAALSDRVDADLALGAHAQLVGELEAIVREHPLREGLVARLMLALYRSGRQAEALDAYRAVRQRKIADLGLEPGRELRELQQGILAEDAALDPPASARPLGHPRPQARRLLMAAGAFLLALLIIVAVRLADSGARALLVAPNSLAAIDVRSDRIAATVPVGARPGSVAVGAGSLWVANRDDQTVSRIDPRTLRTLRTVPVKGPPTGLAASAGAIWVAESDLNPDRGSTSASVLVGRIDPEFDALGAGVRIGDVVPDGPAAIAAQAGSVWVAPSAGLLTRLDAVRGAVTRQLDPNASPAGVAAGAGAVWLTDQEAGDVVRVDPSGLLTTIPVGDGPSGIAVGAGSVWVADSLAGTVVRIDPDTRSVRDTIAVGRAPAGIAVGAGSVWVADSGDGTISRIDPLTDRVRARIVVGGSPQALAVAGGRAWVSVDARTLPPAGGGTLRMAASFDIDGLDPALAYDSLTDQLVAATCAGLVYYPGRTGPAGAEPAPDAAQALPTRSAGGRTYTFTIRRGLRFSPPSDAPVTARTFKATIERTLSPRMKSPLASHLANIVGARAYMAGRSRHIAGLVAHGHTLVIRLRAPAPDLLARLTQPAFCAVPPDTPVDPDGVRLVPSAGPYYAASVTPHQGVVLLRNPNYHGNRPHRFARIEVAADVSARRAVAEIQAGRADYTTLWGDSGTTGLATRLAARYGAAAHGRQRSFTAPSLSLDSFLLNSRRPLFRSARLRRAVNYAIDRRALAALGDGFSMLPEHPADHYLPPGLVGYRAVRVYPDTPDLPRARALARGAGRRTAVLYTCDVDACRQQAHIVAGDLAGIGIRVEIHSFPEQELFAREARPGEPFDLAYNGWIPDYPDPSAMLEPLLEDRSVAPPLADPGVRRRLAAAARLSGPARYLAYGRLDIDLARREAPLLAFGNLAPQDFFSARIGCQADTPYGLDLAALCPRR
jgi:YVTN family beta-propeller protein